MFGEMPLEKRGLLLKECASPGTPVKKVQLSPFDSVRSFQSLRPAALGRGAGGGGSM